MTALMAGSFVAGALVGLVIGVIVGVANREAPRKAPLVDTPRPERLPAGYVPLSRMTREEVQQHLQRLKPDWTPPTVRTVDLTAPKPEEER